MAKSLRSKRKKRLRTLRREIAEPFYEKKEAAKLAAQEAALAAPRLPVKSPAAADEPAAETAAAMDMEMADGGSASHDQSKSHLKPIGGIGKKKLKKKLKLKGKKKVPGSLIPAICNKMFADLMFENMFSESIIDIFKVLSNFKQAQA
ncbi:hypothetical protein OPV22_029757 [Ensete ventricosum]|uniref:Uncharacterized protein n=1 Tax=Ensete ventricosum TaxID=4639 RepID=A0AAV8PYC6_ENSVE|nr:hypothetical protein OPV22_029757 [Ensete ventricosum]